MSMSNEWDRKGGDVDAAQIDPSMFEQMAWQAGRALRVNRGRIDATSQGTPSAKVNEWRRGKSPSSDRR